MEFMPDRARHGAARETVRQHELLADVHPALKDLGLHARELGIALEQGLQAGRILFPQALPQRDRLLGCLQLPVHRRLTLARVPACELGVQVGDEVAQHLGDRRALPRREVRRGQRL